MFNLVVRKETARLPKDENTCIAWFRKANVSIKMFVLWKFVNIRPNFSVSFNGTGFFSLNVFFFIEHFLHFASLYTGRLFARLCIKNFCFVARLRVLKYFLRKLQNYFHYVRDVSHMKRINTLCVNTVSLQF